MNYKMISRQSFKLFQSEPQLFPNSPQTTLKKWKELGPIDIEEYLNKSLAFLDFDPESIEFKEIERVKNRNITLKISGYFKKGTD